MGYITLFSDFGLQDASVAIAKGILMQHVSLNSIIDITHEVQPFNTTQAAYLFGSAYKNFPPGTCHLLLFDIFHAANPKLVLSEYDGHYFLAPDNTLLPLALKDTITKSWLCLELRKEHSFHNWLHKAGEVVQQLQNNTPASLALVEYVLTGNQPALVGAKTYEVIHVDQFGNVTVNFTREEYERLSPGKRISIKFTKVQKEEVNVIKENYSDEREGHKLCRFNSNGYLEICVNHGKAASLFGLKLGGIHNNIQINFT